LTKLQENNFMLIKFSFALISINILNTASLLLKLIIIIIIIIISEAEMGGACGAYVGRVRCLQGPGGGKPEGKRPLGRPRRRWDDNIKMDLQEV